MGRQENGLDRFDQERRRKERQQKSEERSRKFWSTFLFTENGRPKSGFLVYTFCLAIVFFALHYLSFALIVDWLHPVTEGLSVTFGNFIGSVACSIPSLLAGWLLHRWLDDKRLMLGTYIWLALLAAASVIVMAITLKETGAMPEFLKFFVWFAALPLALGLALFYYLYKRDTRGV